MLGGEERERRPGPRPREGGYRRRDDKEGAPGEFAPSFRGGGFGRGRGAPAS